MLIFFLFLQQKTFKMFKLNIPKKDDSQTLEEFILTLEQQIKDLTFEVGIALDEEKNVKIVKEGNENSIFFDENEKKLMHKSIFTHNHPKNSSHSEEDLKFAYDLDLQEIRVVNMDKVISIKPNKNGWEFCTKIDQQANKIIQEIKQKYANKEISLEETLLLRNDIGKSIAERLNYVCKTIKL